MLLQHLSHVNLTSFHYLCFFLCFFFQHQLQVIAGVGRDLVCIGDKYFRPGRGIFAEILRSLENCGVVLVVMSRNYCKSEFCKYEVEQARLLGKPIIMIFKEKVEENQMSGVMKNIFHTTTRVTFHQHEDQYRVEPGWNVICRSVIQLLD